MRFYKAGSYRRYCDLTVLNLSTMQERKLAANVLLNTLFSWSPDSSRVAYAAYGADDNSYELYTAAISGGVPRKMATLAPQTSDGLWLNPVWDPDGEGF